MSEVFSYFEHVAVNHSMEREGLVEHVSTYQLASAETAMSFMMANATPSTGDAMVQTEWRSPTGSALLVAVNCKARFVLHDQRVKKIPLHNHGDQQAELKLHRAKVQLKSRAATSYMSTKRIVAQTVSGLDFESRAKLGCQLNCLGRWPDLLEQLPTDTRLILHPWRT